MEIISPKYSFVKFNSPEAFNNCCTGEQNFCIPVINEDDTYFQFAIRGDTLDEGNTIFAVDVANIELILLRGTANDDSTIVANTIRNWTITDALTFEKYRTATNEVTYQWRDIFKDIATLLNCDECFQLAIKATITEDNILKGISNCFVRKCSDCFTSVLEYFNDDDYAEFRYCNIDTPINRVRLPIYLSQPKSIEEKSIYRKSGGSIKLLKSLLTKEYLVQTEHFPEHIHDKITVALAHDYPSITSDSYTGGISKNGDYTIEWVDNICMAPANFKATATPLAIRNTNCADCKEVDISGDSCVGVNYNGDVMPPAFVGVPYNYSFNLTGDAPFVLASITSKPAWMTISLSGNTITFSGNPTVAVVDTPVVFTVTNCNGNQSLDYSQSLDVDESCIGVSIPDTVLPHAVVGVPYNQSIILGGTRPFVLDIINKPAWMTITIVGNAVSFTGTPTVVASGLPIIFNVSNCEGANTAGYVGSIDVEEAAGDCEDPTEIIALNTGTNSAEFGWTLAGPYPSGGFDWEVYQATTFVSSGNYNVPPNTDLLITGLNPSTDYHIRIRANCGGGDYSDWVDKTFSTTS